MVAQDARRTAPATPKAPNGDARGVFEQSFRCVKIVKRADHPQEFTGQFLEQVVTNGLPGARSTDDSRARTYEFAAPLGDDFSLSDVVAETEVHSGGGGLLVVVP